MKTKVQNSKNKIPNTQKGITLVALVITIIVLLILAGVAINMAINSDGLFSKANEATTKWNSTTAEEDRIIQNILEQMNEINGENTEQATISLNKSTLELEIVDGVNAEEILVATKQNLSGTLTWTSSVPTVATVDSNGKVTAVGAGETIITVSCDGESTTCIVTVNRKISFSIDTVTHYSPEGWDWETWCNDSNYNTAGCLIIDGFVVIADGSTKVTNAGGVLVSSENLIIQGHNYRTGYSGQ